MYNENLPEPRPRLRLTARWLADLRDTVLGLRLADGPGYRAARSADGQEIRLDPEVRHPVVPAVVVAQAAAAEETAAGRLAGWGTMTPMVGAVLDRTFDPPDLEYGPELRGGVDQPPPVPFFNLFLGGPSAGPGSMILVAPTPHGWMLVVNDCG